QVGFVVGFPEHHIFSRGDLTPVVEADRSHHEKRLPDGDRAIEEGLTRPHALDRAARVLQDRMEDPEPSASREDAFRDHASDGGEIAANLEPRDRRNRREVEVALRKVPEEIVGGVDRQPGEELGAPFADPLQELDRRVEAERRHRRMRSRRPDQRSSLGATRSSANWRGSNSTRSSTDSPTPTNRIGKSSSRRSATTAPPLADPSSFVMTRPVGGIAWGKSVACCTAFWPTVPSRTRNTSWGAPATFRPMTRPTFRSSSIRPSWVCSRPAVSMMTRLALREIPASTPSNATAAGSPPGAPLTQGTLIRSAQILSWSMAPARYVSAATRRTE